jgi:hypothetical protein
MRGAGDLTAANHHLRPEHNTRVTHDPASNESVTLAKIELPVVCFMDHVLAITARVTPVAGV